MKEGLSETTPDVPAACMVKLVSSELKVMLLPTLMNLIVVPVSSCSAPSALNPVKLFCNKFKEL